MSAPTLLDKEKAMAALACIKGLSPAALKVALRLLHHFNCRTGRCDPGIETLATTINMSVKSVFRAIDELETLGLFDIDHRRGRGNTNRYHPNYKRMEAHEPISRNSKNHNALNRGKNLTSMSRKPDNLSPKNMTNMSGEHMREHINEHMKEAPREHRLNPIVPKKTNFARQKTIPAHKRDPKSINWNGWIQWLKSIGFPNETQWIMNAIDRAKAEADLTTDQAYLLVNKCLKKARATWPNKKSLDALLTEAIMKQRSKGIA